MFQYWALILLETRTPHNPESHYAQQRRGHSEWVQKDDIFVVDRGFRDSLDYLEQMEIKGKISIIPGQRRQEDVHRKCEHQSICDKGMDYY